LPGLAEGVIPIVPTRSQIRVGLPVASNGGRIEMKKSTIRRQQLPLTPAYVFTDYRSQGQTISNVIVDVTSPLTGSDLSLFNIYVSLSRSSGRDTIRILRDFN
ncbi:hypothetical protein BC834DRAFT_785986, partial [Gloeopeniophorella convolvens]